MLAPPAFTLALAATLGVVLMALAHRLRVPSIAFLLIVGVAVGPEALGIIDPDALGDGLAMIVGMTVAVILFEGGLTLDLAGARKNPQVIWRVLTIGVLITWLGATLITHYLLALPWSMALLCGSLVIVTGPTVIAPLLRRIGVRERIKHILYWEAVLVDAIGVFIAVLCFEWLFPAVDHSSWSPLARFGARVALGITTGMAFGAATSLLLRARLVSEEHANIFVLSMALLSYALCEALLHESGVLAVIVAGLVVGLTKPVQLARIRRFKLELTELGIGTLFILLSARLQLDSFLAFGWKLAAAVALLLLVLRPLVIVIATKGADFSVQEKLFLSWIAPRGIVAAFMASLFAISMARDPSTAAYGHALQAFTFAVIATTVILQGSTASWLARILGLQARKRNTWLLVGPPALVAPLAASVRRVGGHAIALADPESRDQGVARGDDELIYANPADPDLLDDPRLADVGSVLAITPHRYLNQLICEHWREVVRSQRCFVVAESAPDRKLIEMGFIGRMVWGHALPPVDMAHRLEAGSMALDVIPAGHEDALDPAALPLFLVHEDTDVEACEDAQVAADERALVVLRPRIEGLATLIRDAVVLDHEPLGFEVVITRLLEVAVKDNPGLPGDELLATIVRNEQYMPMALGAGIAIPHAYHAGIERSRCYVANALGGLLPPVVADSADATPEQPAHEPIQLVFLVLSPTGRAEEHLRSLATIARLTSEPAYKKLLEEQKTRERLLARIMSRA